MSGKMRIEYEPLSALCAAPRNPKNHRLDLLDQSLERFGYVAPILKDERTGRLVAGHGRLEQLGRRRAEGKPPPNRVDVDANGEWLIPVVRGVTFASDAEAAAYLLADNRVSELGGWDPTALQGMVTDLGADGLIGTGFTAEEVSQLLARVEVALPPEVPVLHDVDEVPALVKAEPITKLGDVIALGRHRLVCGDSTDPQVWRTLLGDRTADIVWTDPPYGVDMSGKNAFLAKWDKACVDRAQDTIENDTLSVEDLGAFLHKVFGLALAGMKPGGAWYVAAPGGPHLLAFLLTLVDFGVFHQQIAWVKPSFVLGRSDYHWRHENLLYGWKPGAAHYFVDDRTQDSVWEIDCPRKSDGHPTMQPVELVARALRNSSHPGDLVVDCFGGSGTTLIAAEQEGREARLIELSPTYCDVICARYEQVTGQKVLR